MNLKKIGAIMMSAAVAVSASGITTLAADSYTDGTYSGKTEAWNASTPSAYSMCNEILNNYSNITVKGNTAVLVLRAFSPIIGKDSIGSASIEYNGVDYGGSIVQGEGTMTAVIDSDLAGVKTGEDYTYQQIDFAIPVEALDSLENDGLTMDITVGPMNNAAVSTILTIKDIKSTGTTEPEATTQDMEITASVEEEVSEPSYTVTVPSSVALGKLSADTDNSKEYAVNVAAKDLNGTISVSAPESGSLTSADNTLAFANSFGTQTVSADTEGTDLSGAISVKAADVAAAAAGNYTGTTTFSISYAAN